jgi:integration host factor subunit beta
MNTVTKRDLVQRISENTKVQQQKAKEVIQGFLDEIIAELASGNRLEFRDFGVFEPKAKAPRTARNPRTGARIQVPEKMTVKFKAGRMMKEKMQPTPKPEATPPDPGLPETGSPDAPSAPAP